MYRLPELVADNIPLLGRYNLVVGLIEKTAASPPSPISPPSYPAFPGSGSSNSSIEGIGHLLMYAAVVVAVLAIGSVTYYRCRRSPRIADKQKGVVQDTFVSSKVSDKKKLERTELDLGANEEREPDL